MSYNLNLPNIPGGPVEMQVAKLRSYLHQTIGQLNFILNNLTEEEAVESAAGLTAEEVSSLTKKAVKIHTEDKDNPHGVTAEQVGAAPTGFGLGESAKLVSVSKLSALTQTGWNRFGVSPSDKPLDDYGGLLRVEASNLTTVQTAYISASDECFGTVATRQMLSGETDFRYWEWINPPMELGVEYRTTERWMGKAVYTKLIDCGMVAPQKSVSIETGATYMIRYTGQFITNGGTPWVVPFCDSGSYSNYWISLGVQKSVIYIRAGSAYEGGSGQLYVQVWYTKD